MNHPMILIVDFGSQFTQLIARRIREMHVYCEIIPCTADMASLSVRPIKGIILSGGPASLADADAPRADERLFSLGVPILGVCYGMQLLTDKFGGTLIRSEHREYGRSIFSHKGNGRLFADIAERSTVWMSHGDSVVALPEGFTLTGSTDSLPTAAMEDSSRNLFGVQFHPEVHHTEIGSQILKTFVFSICNLKGDWTAESFVDEAIGKIQARVGDCSVVLGISGGVDSTVAAVLLHRAIGSRLHAVYVNTGLLRKHEFPNVISLLSGLGVNLHPYDGSELFLGRLAGVVDPEQKRKIIGTTFVDIFEAEAERLGKVDFLAQGTLYPDVIESVSFKGPSVTIKSHHNVGGLKDRMKLQLIEPLRELFKDEVRLIGRQLGIDESFLRRHPFPGPGLAVRIIGDVTAAKCDLLREVDAIFMEELESSGLYDSVWQAFAVLLPVQSVGVMGDERTYEQVVALRAVTSVDGMTADWARLPYEFLAQVSNRIIRTVRGVNRVTYDISSKPPATIEWE